MIDDLVTREVTEPYRLFTSRAEYRLLLRQDNADLRLSPIGFEAGLIDTDRHRAVEARREAIAGEIKRLERTHFSSGDGQSVNAAAFLRRTGVDYQTLISLDQGSPDLSPEVREQVEIEVKYQGYIERQNREVARVHRLEERHIPAGTDYGRLSGLRTEAGQKLARFRPATLGQASRIDGVTPADIAILLIHLQRPGKVS